MNLAAGIADRSPLATGLLRVAAVLQNLGPYAAIELLLPGGSLLALLLWFYRHRRGSGPRSDHVQLQNCPLPVVQRTG